jgi:hypothetical protein
MCVVRDFATSGEIACPSDFRNVAWNAAWIDCAVAALVIEQLSTGSLMQSSEASEDPQTAVPD